MSSNGQLDTFLKNFHINTDITDIAVGKFKVEPYYDTLEKFQEFGEKKCLLYHLHLTIFNVEFSLKLLSFTYDDHSEVLKLEINVSNDSLSKEIAPCKNFLQRKRNMNLTFILLTKYAKLQEMRRLICLTVFEKMKNVLTAEGDNGILVKCCNQDFSIKYLEINWTFAWNVDNYEVSDFIEFYCKNAVLNTQIKRKLEVLVQPNLSFQSKLKLWKLVMADLYGSTSTKKLPIPQNTGILEIIDSDSDDSLIEIDCKNDGPHQIKDEILIIE